MEENFNEATAQLPQGDPVLDAKMITIDLPAFMGQIRKEKPWKDRDRNAITVFKTNGMRIVLIALHSGAEIPKHKADGLISVQVLEGQLLFITDERSVELGAGQMLALHEGIPHSLLAKVETVFLLTLTTQLAENNGVIKAKQIWSNIL